MRSWIIALMVTGTSMAHSQVRSAISGPIGSPILRSFEKQSHCNGSSNSVFGDLGSGAVYATYNYSIEFQSFLAFSLACEYVFSNQRAYSISFFTEKSEYWLTSSNQRFLADRISIANTQNVTLTNTEVLGPFLILASLGFWQTISEIESFDIKFGEKQTYTEPKFQALATFADYIFILGYSLPNRIKSDYTSIIVPPIIKFQVVKSQGKSLLTSFYWIHEKNSKNQEWVKDSWTIGTGAEFRLKNYIFFADTSYSPEYYSDPIDVTPANTAKISLLAGLEYKVDGDWSLSGSGSYQLGEEVVASNALVSVYITHQIWGLNVSLAKSF